MESFAFICNSDGHPTCLICHEKLAHNKKSDLETLHYKTNCLLVNIQPEKKEQKLWTSFKNKTTSNFNLVGFVVSLDIAKKVNHLQMVNMSKTASYVQLKTCYVISKTNKKSGKKSKKNSTR